MTTEKVRDIVGWVMLLVFLVVFCGATLYAALYHQQVGVRIVCGMLCALGGAGIGYFGSKAYARLKG
jgi:apolipoprotein N-acyltransferase